MEGILYGVGVGPGNPELMTLKAVRILRKCDMIGLPGKDRENCIAYQIARQAVPELDDKLALYVPIPMTTNQETLASAYKTGSERIKEVLRQGKSVGFLNLGDPTIYGTYMKLNEEIKQAGFQTEIISGITSFCATAATLGIPLVAGQEELHVLPGFYYEEEIEKYKGTKVLMKSAGKVTKVKRKLCELKTSGKIQVQAVTDCGFPTEKRYTDIALLSEDAGYFTTIVIKEK